jgi:hypothetical protein
MATNKILLFVTALTILDAASAWATDDPFIGTWRLNMDRSQYGGDVREIKDLGGNNYRWFGASILTDAKEHPFTFGGTYLATQESPDRWAVTIKHDGKVTDVSTWTLGDGGQQLRFEDKGTRVDSTPFTEEAIYTREGTGSGPSGKWKLQKMQSSSIDNWVIKPYGNEGLSFVWPADKEHEDIKFDGKDYAYEGPRVTPGRTSSAKRIDNYTIQLTDKLNGKVTVTREAKISQDGRTLTETRHRPGRQNPVIIVYEKQM